MERDQASKFVNDLLRLMVSRNGSDLFLTSDFTPAIKVDGKVTKVSPQPLTDACHPLLIAAGSFTGRRQCFWQRFEIDLMQIEDGGMHEKPQAWFYGGQVFACSRAV